jgi:GTP-binding protein
VLADLDRDGMRFRLARGGNGGFGNAHFKSSTNRAPRRANPGQPGQELAVWLRLKLIADAGLVGLPNAGKSTFLATVSAARPKIADYPFTTLHPNLGVVAVDGDEFVMADIPGLIAGAHAGAGLGHKFLRHIERTRVLLHVIDASEPGEQPFANFQILENELKQYSAELVGRRQLILLNKTDLLTAEELHELQVRFAEAGWETLTASALTGQGLGELRDRLAAILDENRV